MNVYVVHREYLNWAEFNGADIIGVFTEIENAEKKLEEVYQEELEFLKEEEYKVVSISSCKHYSKISTVYGDIGIYITAKEVK